MAEGGKLLNEMSNMYYFLFFLESWEYVWYYVKWSKIGSCQVEKQIFYLLINECNLQTVPKGGLCFHSLQKGNLLPINHTKKSKMFTLSIQYFCNTHSLCSRNFQNEKLRRDFVEIWSFYHQSDFMWNPILVNSYGPKMSFLAILQTLNFEFW